METSALMGMNVARLIVDDLLALQTGGDVEVEAKKPNEWAGSSKIDEL